LALSISLHARWRHEARPELAKLMKALALGDAVVVTKLDRFGRSTLELLRLIDQITEAGAFFKSLGDPLWDTSTAQGRLLSTLLAAIAEFERERIRERTGEGRKRAQARGVKFGRPSKLTPHQKGEALAQLQAKRVPTLPAATRSIGRRSRGCSRRRRAGQCMAMSLEKPKKCAVRPTIHIAPTSQIAITKERGSPAMFASAATLGTQGSTDA
jgi:DNA invertase Pin-like site-specific DNA recombinase